MNEPDRPVGTTVDLVLLGLVLEPSGIPDWHRVCLDTTRGQFWLWQRSEANPCRLVIWLLNGDEPGLLLEQSARWLVKRGAMMLALPPWNWNAPMQEGVLALAALAAHLREQGLPDPLVIVESSAAISLVEHLKVLTRASAIGTVPTVQEAPTEYHGLRQGQPFARTALTHWDWVRGAGVEAFPLDDWQAYLMAEIFAPSASKRSITG